MYRSLQPQGRRRSEKLVLLTMMLLGSAFLPALNVPSAARAPARAPAATMGVKAPQSMEGAFVKSRNTLGIQAIRPDAVVPKELRAAIASTFPAKGETTAPRPSPPSRRHMPRTATSSARRARLPVSDTAA